MGREELTRALIMDCIADDYEDLAMIHKEVANWALEEHDVALTNAEITEALMGLLEADLVRAYELSQNPAVELHGAPPLERITGYYFFPTPEGMRLIWNQTPTDNAGA